MTDKTLEDLMHDRNILRDRVYAWVRDESADNNVVRPSDSPHWAEYQKAEEALTQAINAGK